MNLRPAVQSGALFVLLSTVGLALKGIWARLAYAEGMDVGAVLFYRSALSAPLLVVGGLLLLRARGGDEISWRALRPAVLLGVMFAVGMTADFQAIAHLGASVSRVVLFGFPLLVLAFESLAARRWPARHQLLAFFVAWLGLAAVASGGLEGASFGAAALLWGVFSLFLYALYVWLSGKVTHTIGSVRLTMVSQLTTGLIVVSFLLMQGRGSPPPLPMAGFGWIALMVVVSTVVPYFLMMEGIRRLGASQASLLAMGGPVVTVGAGWLVLGESMSWIQLVGTAAVMGGVVLSQRQPSSRAFVSGRNKLVRSYQRD